MRPENHCWAGTDPDDCRSQLELRDLLARYCTNPDNPVLQSVKSRDPIRFPGPVT
jgi:hypothetical protein